MTGGFRKHKKNARARKAVDKSALSKPERRAVKALIAKDIEVKYFGFDMLNDAATHFIYNNPANNTSMYLNVSEITQGIGRDQRIGAKVKMQTVSIDAMFANSFADRSQLVRIMLVSSNDMFNSATGVLNTGIQADFGTTQNDIYRTVRDQLRQRSTATTWRTDRVLMDKSFVLDPKDTGAHSEHHFRKVVKINSMLEYLPGESFPTKKDLYIVMNISRDVLAANATSEGVEFSGVITLAYIDA